MSDHVILEKQASICRFSADAFKHQGRSYVHIFPAISEITDNIDDLPNMGLQGNTAQCRINLETWTKRTDTIAARWTFINDGNPLDFEHLKNMFSLGMSEKSEKAALIGKYGVGLKASATFLGDALLVSSYDPQTETIVFGFFCPKMLKENRIDDMRVLLVQLDSNNPIPTSDDERLFQLMLKYTNFNSTKQLIEWTFGRIETVDQGSGGTVMAIFCNKKHWARLVDNQLSVNRSNQDISGIEPWHVDKVDEANPPLFTTSLRHYLSILYLPKPHKTNVRLFLLGREINRVNFFEQKGLYLGVPEKQWKKNARYASSSSALQSLRWEDVTTTKKPYTNVVRIPRNKIDPEVITDDPSAYIYFFQRGASQIKIEYKDRLMAAFNYALFYNNSRLTEIKRVPRNPTNKFPGFVVVNSGCFMTDNTKQRIIGDPVYTLVQKRINTILRTYISSILNAPKVRNPRRQNIVVSSPKEKEIHVVTPRNQVKRKVTDNASPPPVKHAKLSTRHLRRFPTKVVPIEDECDCDDFEAMLEKFIASKCTGSCKKKKRIIRKVLSKWS